jgi:hypothetical protein
VYLMFPKEYPQVPPEVRFDGDVFHPNVDHKGEKDYLRFGSPELDHKGEMD